MAGITCAEDGPVPITATRFPVMSASLGQSTVCHDSPLNFDAPGIAGILPRLNRPVACMRTFAVHCVRCLVLTSSVITIHSISSSDHTAFTMLWLNDVH